MGFNTWVSHGNLGCKLGLFPLEGILKDRIWVLILIIPTFLFRLSETEALDHLRADNLGSVGPGLCSVPILYSQEG